MNWWTYTIHHSYNRRCVSLLLFSWVHSRLTLFGWCFNYLNTCLISVSMSNKTKQQSTFHFGIFNIFCWIIIEWGDWRKTKRNYIVSYQSTGELKKRFISSFRINVLTHHTSYISFELIYLWLVTVYMEQVLARGLEQTCQTNEYPRWRLRYAVPGMYIPGINAYFKVAVINFISL